METIKKGTQKKSATILLQESLRKAGYHVNTDGIFGPDTDQAVRDFQKKNKLVVDGVVGHKSWMKLMVLFPKLFERLAQRFLSQKDINKVAKDLAVQPAAINAVREVEAGGTGFQGERPKILFEGHVFYRQLKKHGINPVQHLAGNEDILYPDWSASNRKYYKMDQYARLKKAKKIDAAAAMESASWGLFQIMGYHWKDLGYKSVKKFVKQMRKDEGEHLKAFAAYLKANNLVKPLQALDWATFAEGYNGSGYKENQYDTKMASAYRRYSQIV